MQIDNIEADKKAFLAYLKDQEVIYLSHFNEPLIYYDTKRSWTIA
jgi:hypothetical protein